MKIIDILLILACIAFLACVYFASNAELRAVFNLAAVICGVVLGVRLGKRLRNNS